MVDTFSWARLSSERMEMMVSVCQESLSHHNVAVFSSAALLLNSC